VSVQALRVGPRTALPVQRGRGQPQVAFWGRLFIVLSLMAWAASPLIGFQASLSMLTLCAFVAAVAGLRHPVVGLLGMTVLCTLDPVMNTLLFTGGIWRWNTLNYLLLAVATIFAPLVLGLRDPHSRLLQLFALLLGLEILISPDWLAGVQILLELTAFFGLMVYFLRAGPDPMIWCWAGLVSGTVAAFGALAYMLQRADLPPMIPNAWAFFPLSALFAICMASPFAKGRPRFQLPLSILAACNVGWVFLSGSRGSLLTAVACAAILLIQARGGRRVTLILSLGLVAMVISSVFTDLQTKMVERLTYLVTPNQALVYRTSGRSDLAIAGWYIFREHPLGVGTGGFATSWLALGSADGLSGWGRGTKKDAHAGWIMVLADNGAPGVILLAAFAGSFAVAGWRRRKRGLLLMGLLGTTGLSLGLLTTEFQNKGLWFLLSGVAVLLHYRALPPPIRTRRA
jgi:hypothetical protein